MKMETKEIKINVECPEGYTIDKENSTFECIKFKPVVKRWRDDESADIKGFYIDTENFIRYYSGKNIKSNRVLFATEKQAKSALAMAQISQIMANDKRFGGAFTKFDGAKDPCCVRAYAIIRNKYKLKQPELHIVQISGIDAYQFLTFNTHEQAELFLKENEDLVKDYLMID